MINEKSYLNIASKFAGDDSYITESADAKKDEKDGAVIIATEDEKTGVESVPVKNKQQPKATEGKGTVPKINETEDEDDEDQEEIKEATDPADKAKIDSATKQWKSSGKIPKGFGAAFGKLFIKKDKKTEEK